MSFIRDLVKIICFIYPYIYGSNWTVLVLLVQGMYHLSKYCRTTTFIHEPINIICFIYRYLYKQNWTFIARLLQWIYRLLAPRNEIKENRAWLYKWGKLGLKIKLLQQRKIYLLEHIDSLKKALPSTSPTDWEVQEEEEDNEGAAINGYESEVLRINQRLFLLYQSRKDLYIDRPRSPIIAQIPIDDRSGRLWGHFRRHCEIGGGAVREVVAVVRGLDGRDMGEIIQRLWNAPIVRLLVDAVFNIADSTPYRANIPSWIELGAWDGYWIHMVCRGYLG